MDFVLSARIYLISALSATLCCVSTVAIELECFCLSAKICRFWWPLIAKSHSVAAGTLIERDEVAGRGGSLESALGLQARAIVLVLVFCPLVTKEAEPSGPG